MSVDLWRTTPYAHLLHHVVGGLPEQPFTPVSQGPTAVSRPGVLAPPVTVWETDEAYIATLLAPGLNEQTIKVVFHADTLLIEGDRTVTIPDGARAVWQEF